jgi:hypothetical protein
VAAQVAAEGRERSTVITQICASSSYRRAVIRHRAASLTNRELGIACTKRGSSMAVPSLDHDLRHLVTIRGEGLGGQFPLGHALADGPDEAGALTRDRDHRLIAAYSMAQVVVALMAA